MGREVELKLQIAAEDAGRLIQWAEGLGEVKTLPLRAIYFDTPGRALTKAGMSLRVRHDGTGWVQTVKADGKSGAGFFDRDEWEKPVPGPEPEIGEDTPLIGLPPQTREALLPMFEVLVERRVFKILRENTAVEVAIDSGEVVAEERHSAFCEVELELESGDPHALFSLAREIDAAAPARLGTMTKAERGRRLREVVADSVKAEPIALSPDESAEEAVGAIAAACLRQYRLNEDILLRRRAPDALHQARVALRRLRSALSIFKKVVADERGERLGDELKWLAGELGKARDLDVLLKTAHTDDLRHALVEERAAAYQAVKETLLNARTRTLLLDMAQWLATGAWRDREGNEAARKTRVGDISAAALAKLFRRFKKQSAGLEKLSDAERHEARKLAKKLRYGAEFFGGLYGAGKVGKRYEQFLDRLETVQDALGNLNDLATRPVLLDRHGLTDAEAGAGEGERSELVRRAASACDALIDTKPFWK